MFRTFLLSRLEQNIGRKGIFSPFIVPLGRNMCALLMQGAHIMSLTGQIVADPVEALMWHIYKCEI